MPSERFAAALNEQVGREFAAAHQYVAIGTHYEDQTFPRLADFFYEQAEEEREHPMKMVKYLLDTNCAVELGTVAAPTNQFESHIEPIKLALEHERKVSVHISELFEIARKTKDYQSEQFMQWFLDEQAGRRGIDDAGPAAGRRAHPRDPDAARGIRRARTRRLTTERTAPAG